MKFKIISLGPLKEKSEIELNDLTVFFGPPNSGKSTALKAIYYSLYPPIITEVKDTVVNLGSLKIEYNIKDNTYEFKFYPSADYLKDLLPEGEFSVEPQFIKFVEENSLFDHFKGTLENPSIILPSDCKGVSEVPYEVEISGKIGKVTLYLTNEFTQKCKEPLYVELSKKIMPIVGKRIINKYMEKFIEYLKKEEKISDVVFIPYSRSFAVFELLSLAELVASKISFPSSSNTYPISIIVDVVNAIINHFIFSLKSSAIENILGDIKELEIYFDKIKEKKEINEKVYRLLKPLIPGDVRIINNKLTYIEDERLIPWKYTSASVMEVVSLLLSIGQEQLILYEEPETQLHEGLQLLMALVLYAMSSFNKLVITTHSQTILYTLAYISLSKPRAEDVLELLKSLEVRGGAELAKAVEEANSKTVRFYFFHNGKVEEKNAEEIIQGIPGVVDIMHKEFDWLSKLYWRNKLNASNNS
ncbi:AAA family ATPase [Sulfurisphaera ohwakuensis]|uniref:AAA family ATPase n=1 Tax=Sulfurisphaera ohwakuensis TaxID=69656 RepID=UPI0036F1DC8E